MLKAALEVLEDRVVPAGVQLVISAGDIPYIDNSPGGAEVAGDSVQGIGDLNGGGSPDFLVTYGDYEYVVFGEEEGPDISLSTLINLQGYDGFRIISDDYHGNHAYSSAYGDINGDGYDDLVISNSATAHVIFGRDFWEEPMSSTVNLSQLDGSNGFRIDGIRNGYAGNGVGVGDFNGDGYADILIGNTFRTDSGDQGACVIFGKSEGFAGSMSLEELDGTNGFRIFNSALDAEGSFHGLGTAVSAAGDFNGDGIDDMLIGVNRFDVGSTLGAAFIVFGKNDWSASYDLASLDGSNGFAFIAPSSVDSSRISLAAAGDFNNDGRDDILIGVPDTNTLSNGVAYVIYGTSVNQGSSVSLQNLDGSKGVKIVTDQAYTGLGFAVAGVGDFNGDKIDDIVVQSMNPYSGHLGKASYVVFGSENAPGEINVSNLHGANGFAFASQGPFSARVSALGDVDRDGDADILIGSSSEESGALRRVSHILFGHQVSDVEVVISKNGKTATYIDGNENRVTLRTTKGDFHNANFVIQDIDDDYTLYALDLNGDSAWSGASLTVKSKFERSWGFEREADIRLIDASGIDLKSVKIEGNLSGILVGDQNLETPAIRLLSVESMTGANPVSFGHPTSVFEGELSKLEVKGYIRGVDLQATSIGKIVAGSIIGDSSWPFYGHTLIDSDTTIGSITIKGDLRADAPGGIMIRAAGNEFITSVKDAMTIGKVSVGGSVTYSDIIAGWGGLETGGARIGKVSVNGDWIASSLIAGMTGGGPGQWGTGNESFDRPPGVVSPRIESLVIKGEAHGSDVAGEHFGIHAQEIGKVKVGRLSLPLTGGYDDLLLGESQNLRLIEIAPPIMT